MTTPETQIICPNCGYNLAGLAQPQSSSRSCPECGMSGIPAESNGQLTARFMHQYFATRLLIPTTLPFVVLLVLLPLWPATSSLACMSIIFFPVYILTVLSLTKRSMIEAGQRPPHLVRQSTIPLYAWIYTAPAFVSYLIYLRLAL